MLYGQMARDRKTPKNLDTQKFAVITLTFEQGGFTVE